MLKLSIQSDRKRGVCRLEARGHANTAPRGRDTVCAAASILCYALAHTLLCMRDEGRLEEAPEIVMNEAGHARISAKAAEGQEAELCRCFEMACGGFALLEKERPGHVRLVEQYGEALSPDIKGETQ